GVGNGYMLAGAVIRSVLTLLILAIMQLALWRWTWGRREINSSRGQYTSVRMRADSSATGSHERSWILERRTTRPPPPLNLHPSTADSVNQHRRNKSGES